MLPRIPWRLVAGVVVLVGVAIGIHLGAQWIGRIQGERDAAIAVAEKAKAATARERRARRAETTQHLATISALEERAARSLDPIEIRTVDTVLVAGVPTWTHPAVVGALADCQALVAQVPVTVAAVRAEHVATDREIAADSVLVEAHEAARPGWLRRHWEAIDQWVFLVAGVVGTAMVAGADDG